jgi:hemoglobin/transferrin/lactoferrin receptor protein
LFSLLFLWLFLLIPLGPRPLFAQGEGEIGPGSADEPIDLGLIIVSARGYATEALDIPGGVEVAGDDELNRGSRHGSLADALDAFPGISRTGESPYAQDISIRGLSGPSIVILVNGKRINTATDINARLGYINPADVERIEVLKGPLSALYGSGSTGGVVNIITRKPSEFRPEAEASGRITLSGSSNPEGGLGYGYLAVSSPRVSASISAGYRQFGKVYGFDRNEVPNSQFQDVQGRASLSWKPSDKLILTSEFIRSLVHDAGIPGGSSAMPNIARISYPRGEFTLISEDMELSLDRENLKKIEASLYFTSNRRRVRIDNVGPATPQPIELWPKADHDTYGGKLSSTWNFGNNTLVTGLDFWTWKMESSRRRTVRVGTNYFTSIDHPSPKTEQVSIGAFASDTLELTQDLSLYFGGRLDRLRTKNEALFFVNPVNFSQRLLFDAGSKSDLGWQLHLGGVWRSDSGITNSFLVSSAYRAADIMERFKYINLAGLYELYGNPDLDPERSAFFEYKLGYDKGPIETSLSVFMNLISDYIAEKAETPSVRRLYNIESARIYGTEFSASYSFPRDFKLSGSLAYLYGDDRANDQPLPGVAPLDIKLSLEYSPPSGFWAGISHRRIGAQTRTPLGVSPSKKADVTSLQLGYLYAGRVTHDLSLVVDNLFDEEYKNYLANERGYTIWEPGLSASINYTFSF